LRLYGAGLAERPQIVVLNKLDLVGAPPAFSVDDPRVRAVLPVSAVTGDGVDELKRLLFALVSETAEAAGPRELADFLVYRPRGPARREFRILRTERGYAVWAREPERIDEDALERALRAAGARDGDLVTLGDRTFELG
jgi:GTP-binding protein